MPYSPKAGCKIKTCPERVYRGNLCKKHYNEWACQIRKDNPAQERYDWRWNKARKLFLSQNPLCVICQKEGKVRGATVVDHIVRHKGDFDKFWDESNWQSLCTEHHNQKTADEVFRGR